MNINMEKPSGQGLRSFPEQLITQLFWEEKGPEWRRRKSLLSGRDIRNAALLIGADANRRRGLSQRGARLPLHDLLNEGVVLGLRGKAFG